MTQYNNVPSNMTGNDPVVDTQSDSPAKAKGAFLTIREVADLMGVQQHVLRFWETKFSQVKPLKRGGGRRYYRPEDVTLLKNIQYFLHDQGYTIKGVQKLLKAEGKKYFTQGLLSQQQDTASPHETSAEISDMIGLDGHGEKNLRMRLYARCWMN